MMYSMTIPGPPVSWKRTANAAVSGKRITSAECRAHKAAVAMRSAVAMGGHAPIQGPVWLRIVAMVPHLDARGRRRGGDPGEWCCNAGDLDNYIKQIGDALNGIAYVDDRQVVMIDACKMWAVRPATEVAWGLVDTKRGQG